MPPVISVSAIPDGFEIVSTNRGTISLTTADIPKNTLKTLTTPALMENWINNTWLPKVLSFVDADGATAWHFYAKVHVTSLNPMVATCMTSWEPIPDNWWA